MNSLNFNRDFAEHPIDIFPGDVEYPLALPGDSHLEQLLLRSPRGAASPPFGGRLLLRCRGPLPHPFRHAVHLAQPTLRRRAAAEVDVGNEERALLGGRVAWPDEGREQRAILVRDLVQLELVRAVERHASKPELLVEDRLVPLRGHEVEVGVEGVARCLLYAHNVGAHQLDALAD